MAAREKLGAIRCPSCGAEPPMVQLEEAAIAVYPIRRNAAHHPKAPGALSIEHDTTEYASDMTPETRPSFPGGSTWMLACYAPIHGRNGHRWVPPRWVLDELLNSDCGGPYAPRSPSCFRCGGPGAIQDRNSEYACESCTREAQDECAETGHHDGNDCGVCSRCGAACERGAGVEEASHG